MGTKKPYNTAKQVIKAIKGSGGIKQTIADRLGVHRNTVTNYLERYATARQAYEDECQRVGDLAESVVIKAIKDQDVSTAKWYCSKKLADRGYVDRQEFTGKDGEPMELRTNLIKEIRKELKNIPLSEEQ